MHEASLMARVFEIAWETLRHEQATRVHRLKLRVGAWSGVVPEALAFAFAALKPGTPAASAKLEVEWTPLTLYCPACDQEYETEMSPDLCPQCGAVNTEVRSGQELDLVSLEMSCGDESPISR